MTRAPLLIALLMAGFGIIGCATGAKSTPAPSPSAADMSGLTVYYAQATAPQHRAVRKPIRDQRERALRLLARRADTLLAESKSWDSPAQLAAWPQSERPTARTAVADFRNALKDLRSAAAKSDVVALRDDYPRVLAAYRHLSKIDGAAE